MSPANHIQRSREGACFEGEANLFSCNNYLLSLPPPSPTPFADITEFCVGYGGEFTLTPNL